MNCSDTNKCSSCIFDNCKIKNPIIRPVIINVKNIPSKNDVLAFFCIGFIAISLFLLCILRILVFEAE